MDHRLTLDWLQAAMIRAIKTMAQTALSMISVGAAMSDIDWKMVLSVSMVAFIYSILTSIATGLPESKKDGELKVTESDDKVNFLLDVDTPLMDLGKKDYVRLKVKKELVPFEPYKAAESLHNEEPPDINNKIEDLMP